MTEAQYYMLVAHVCFGVTVCARRLKEGGLFFLLGVGNYGAAYWFMWCLPE